jgi:hypothetical protein
MLLIYLFTISFCRFDPFIRKKRNLDVAIEESPAKTKGFQWTHCWLVAACVCTMITLPCPYHCCASSFSVLLEYTGRNSTDVVQYI